MKIAIWHNLPSGGGKRALYEHVAGLLERGHTLESWCPPTADQSYLPLGNLIPEHVVPLRWPPRTRLRDIVGARLSTVRKIEAMNEHCQCCAEQIDAGNFDILFANSCAFFRTTAIGRYVHLPKVLYLQEPYRWLYEAMPQLPWLALPPGGAWWWTPSYVRAFVRDWRHVQGLRVQAREEVRNAAAYDAILVNSLFSRESVLRAYGLDAQVCYLGIDTAKFRDHELPREPFVIGMGAFTPEKNPKLVIEGLARVASPRPRLVWIGNTANRGYIEELQALAQSLQVDFEPRVGVSDDALVDLLNRALLMVYAPRLEPFGLAPLEANACGLPVVAVAEGGVRETVIDGVTGIHVLHDPRAIAAAIERLRDNPDNARQLGEQGRTRVANEWTLRAAARRLEQRLDERVSISRAQLVPAAG